MTLFYLEVVHSDGFVSTPGHITYNNALDAIEQAKAIILSSTGQRTFDRCVFYFMENTHAIHGRWTRLERCWDSISPVLSVLIRKRYEFLENRAGV
jgi:hypothetical protein